MDMQERRNYIGGSDIASICGMGFKTPVEIYLEKAFGYEKTASEELQAWFERGKILEPFIKRLFEERSGHKVTLCEKEIIHPEKNFLRGHIDGYMIEEKTIIEFKSALHFTKKEYGEEYTDNIKEHYLLQGVHYLNLLPEMNQVLFPILFGSQKEFSLIIKNIIKYGIEETLDNFKDYDLKLSVYKSERNKALGDRILEISVKFYEENVQKKCPPKEQCFEDVRLLFPKGEKDKTVLASEDDIKNVFFIKEKMEFIKNIEKEIEERKRGLCNKIAEAEILKDCDGNVLATWKNQGRTSLSTKRIMNECPELFDKYKETKEYRVFKV